MDPTADYPSYPAGPAHQAYPAHAASPAYPVLVDAQRDPRPSRWLWLLKWLLALPHYIVLAFLWIGVWVVSIVAFFAILITGRYPRPLFAFTVGVLRWTWRVSYYSYGTLGTDRYPPFTLAEVPDYPAHLDASYPERLSRPLVLVKWWLLAIPHYLVLAVFLGGSVAVTTGNVTLSTGGLIALLVFFAAIGLLFTGRYPLGIYDFVLGMNRWVLRTAGYALLLTDSYPPFRLDLGPADPAAAPAMVPPPRERRVPTTSPTPAPEAPGQQPTVPPRTPRTAPAAMPPPQSVYRPPGRSR